MLSTPPRFDMWLVAHLATLLGRYPTVDLAVESGMVHNVLGGLWYAAMLFLFWIQGSKVGQRNIRKRVVTTLFGSAVAVALTVLGAMTVSWAPPSAHPELAGFYPEALPPNLNSSSFPSQSTALYAAVAAGVYSLQRRLGALAWTGVVLLVAVPRMYFGGHYLTDVLAGLVAGAGGYWVAVALLEPKLVSRCDAVFEYSWGDWRWVLAEFTVFVWILQIATKFSDVLWVAGILGELWGRILELFVV